MSAGVVVVDARAKAPCWHAFRDAPRHNSVLQRVLDSGRRASRTAFPRRALIVIHKS
ncbi:DUF1534 domain-containing protein [Pseudomonas syringae USA011]|nr:DUF1534 domain-containing protein [Pseudomonas syringae USA011]